VGLRLLIANGEILDCDAPTIPDIVRCTRLSLGALGVDYPLRLQNPQRSVLRSRNWIQNTEELLDDMAAADAR